MKWMSALISTLYFSCLSFGKNCEDVSYINISDARRSTAYDSSLNLGINPICDRDIINKDSWYRFTNPVGNQLATTPQNIYKCGTYHPIWMKGTHPTVEDGSVRRTACMNTIFFPLAKCDETFTITVLNCSGYYIYKLKPPMRCYEAYCAGTKKPQCTNKSSGQCPNNQPPYFTMATDTFYVVSNKQLRIPILAKDPEHVWLIYSVLRPNTTYKDDAAVIDYGGILTVKTNETGRVYVRIEDDGGNTETFIIEIVVQVCPCMNNGTCDWNHSTPQGIKPPTYTCVCVSPYIGVNCQNISDAACEQMPCFPGVKCTATKYGYDCDSCPPVLYDGDGKKCEYKKDVVPIVIAVEITIMSGLQWDDDLKNRTSFHYRRTSNNLIDKLKKKYDPMDGFVNVVVIAYKKGSVVVHFQLIFTKHSLNPLAPLENSVTLGNLVLDKNETKVKESASFTAEITVIRGLKWNDDLRNTSSAFYKKTSDIINMKISGLYMGKIIGSANVNVIGYWKGSVVVRFQLFFTENVLEPLAPLKNCGTLGNLVLDKAKTKVIGNNDDIEGHGKVIAFITVVLFLLLISTLATVATCIKKQRKDEVLLNRQGASSEHRECGLHRGKDSYQTYVTYNSSR